MKSVCMLVQSVYDFDPRVRRKAEALVAAGYSVDVLALAAGGRPKTLHAQRRERPYAVARQEARIARRATSSNTPRSSSGRSCGVPVLMRRRRYAVVDVNTLPDFLVFAPVFARWMGAQLVLDMHEITPEFYQSKYGDRARARGSFGS